ncbi:MAG: hypothetical protein JXR94_05700, partial [Candidatus Hydrogenedentes bacterium]|nr:hypothetical protein [Candidatus Hydrogenedentota bacterium]
MQQLDLICRPENRHWGFPQSYRSVVPRRFRVARIILCKGSLATPGREAFVRRICAAYPHVPVEERLDLPHNRVEFGEPDPVRRVARGKRTLVFGVIAPRHALWGGDGQGGYYTNRRRLSLYSFCFYDCPFCYLSGRDGVWFSPAVRIYVNLPEILAEADRLATAAGRPIEFCAGDLQDGLALDPLTAYSTVLVPFFARHRYARFRVLTKSVAVERLLDLPHGGHTTLAWTLNPPAIGRLYEPSAPPVDERIEAMGRCHRAGYPVQASIMPIIPYGDWEGGYLDFVRRLLDRVPLTALTLGGVSMEPRTRLLLERRLGPDNPISRNLHPRPGNNDKMHYPPDLC